jgi:hypothetical protein
MSELMKPFLDKIKYVEQNLENFAENIVKKNADYIIMILREEQLGQGFDGFGEALVHPTKQGNPSRTPLYEKSTEEYWTKVDPPRNPSTKKYNNRYDFQWSGNFVDNLKIEYESEGFSIFSRAGKQRALEAIYGTKLTKLTEKNNSMINNDIILPELQKYILENVFVV